MSAPQFDTSYAKLPSRFFTRMEPSPVKAPRLLKLNSRLAEKLGLDATWLQSDAGLAMLSGNAFPPSAASIATVYAGHQFGHFSPQLGDGRAVLIGEILDINGKPQELQLKGSGPTPYSRRGDGRSALGPALREYLISEAMHSLGIPTTRSLAVVSTGEWVWREPEQPGGILTRVASSHIRVGTFQYFAAQGDSDAVRILCQKMMIEHYPSAKTHKNPILSLLKQVIAAQAKLIADWMRVGFVHGVMNTDNMALSGETIDYGPCAFLDSYDPQKVFSSIDRDGRYAFGNQPRIANWNLARFAETLLPLLHDDPDAAVQIATEAINQFPALFEAAMTRVLSAKLGLAAEHNNDLALAQDLLSIMAANGADYTLTFRKLADLDSSPEAEDSLRQLFAISGGIDSWIVKWRERISLEARSPQDIAATMHAANPAIIPRNHLVEAALKAAVDENDLVPFDALLEAISNPFSDAFDDSEFALPPTETDPHYKTFCGT
jgi:serine/tyrosine/threonine adenylyltransferase